MTQNFSDKLRCKTGFHCEHYTEEGIGREIMISQEHGVKPDFTKISHGKMICCKCGAMSWFYGGEAFGRAKTVRVIQ